MCVGVNSQDMAVAVNHVAANGGGQVVVDDGKVIEFLPLPIGGIVARVKPARNGPTGGRVSRPRRGFGCNLSWAFMYLFFLPITAIPDYAMTDVGPIDVVHLRQFEPVLGPA